MNAADRNALQNIAEKLASLSKPLEASEATYIAAQIEMILAELPPWED